jgi:O-acetylhomoserine (thiol)-lyase
MSVKRVEIVSRHVAGHPAFLRSEATFGGRCPEDAGFSTKCLYAGQEPDPVSGARTTPITMSTGFVFQDSDDAAAKFALQAFGPIYTRITNPTSDAVEKKIAALEGGSAALAVSSGHAAQMLCFTNIMMPGDHIVSTDKLYGGTVTQFSRQFAQFGWQVTFVSHDDFAGMEAAITPKTKAIYCEAIANPGGLICDIRKYADIAHKHGLPLIVDNTTATPYLCRPFEHGADVIVHSATKGLCGHGNAMGGFIVEKGDFDWSSGKYPIISEPCASYHGVKMYETFGKDGPVAEMLGTKGVAGISFIITARVLGLRDVGMCISPFNAFLISMGMETLPLRMQKTAENTLATAKFLSSHPKVSWVRYGGLPGATSNELMKTYCPLGAGGLFTFGLKGGYDAGKYFVDNVKMISLVANLGDSRTLVAHPASMMHSQLTEEQRKAAGAETETIRISIGLEDAKDIIADLKQAIEGFN